MFPVFTSAPRQFGRYLLAAPLAALLALSAAPAHAQVAPTPAPAQKPLANDAIYYVDGKLASKDALALLAPSSIGSINVLKSPDQRKALGFNTTASDGVVVITTKEKTNSPEVLAFNSRVEKVVPLVRATPEQTAGMEAAKAYILKTYPSAKLEMVGPARDKPGYYQTFFSEGGKRMQLLFDGQGQPVKQ